MMYCDANAAQMNFPSQASLRGKSGRDFSKSEVIFSAVTLLMEILREMARKLKGSKGIHS